VVGGVDADSGPVPARFVAVTTTVYGAPLVSPAIVHWSGPEAQTHFDPPGDAVAVYAVIAIPPLEAGTDHVTTIEPSRAEATGPVGTPGIVRGTAALEAADEGLDPASLIATTVNVYGDPFVRPVTAQVRGPAVQVHVFEPGLDVTVYPVIAAPPIDDGAVQPTTTAESPGDAVTPVGAPGMVRGVAGELSIEGPLDPSGLVAVTMNV